MEIHSLMVVNRAHVHRSQKIMLNPVKLILMENFYAAANKVIRDPCVISKNLSYFFLNYCQLSNVITNRCEYGWFGYPKEKGGKCEPCQCNKFGIVSDECDEETGQCNCMPNITGRDCSVCQAKHVLTSKGCTRKLIQLFL